MTNETKASSIAIGGTDPVAPTTEEYAFMAMTPEQREEHIERLRWADAKVREEAKQADLQRRIDEHTATAIANNPQLNGWHTSRLLSLSNGETRSETINSTVPGSTALGYVGFDPPSLAIRWGGIEIPGEQAKAWFEDGTISQKEYCETVSEAAQPCRPGYKHSFRLPRQLKSSPKG